MLQNTKAVTLIGSLHENIIYSINTPISSYIINTTFSISTN